jgi:hypothetical protein
MVNMMLQVLELMYKGSVVLLGSDVESLVNISSLLGCTGDMQQEPVLDGQVILSIPVPVCTG